MRRSRAGDVQKKKQQKKAADLHAARTRRRAIDGWLYRFDLARKAIALLCKLHGRQGHVSDVSKELAKSSVSESVCNQAHHLVAVVVHARNMALEARQWWPVVAQRHQSWREGSDFSGSYYTILFCFLREAKRGEGGREGGRWKGSDGAELEVSRHDVGKMLFGQPPVAR